MRGTRGSGLVTQQIISDEMPFEELTADDVNKTKKDAIKENLKLSLLKRAKEYFNDKKYSEALTCMDKLIKHDIVVSFAYMQKSYLQYALGDFDSSIKCALRCIYKNKVKKEDNTYDFCCYLLIIKSYCVKQEFIKAFEVYTNATIEYYKIDSPSKDVTSFYRQIKQVGERIKDIDMDEDEKKRISLKFQQNVLEINRERKKDNEELYISDIEW